MTLQKSSRYSNSLSREKFCQVHTRTRTPTSDALMASLSRTIWRLNRHARPDAPPLRRPAGATRCNSSSAQLWHARASHPSSRVQVYASHSRDPYLNLSAEHFLLQSSHPGSTVLLLYANDPCVVIGRNQNPWLEVNLGLLRGFRARLGGDGGHGDDGGGGGESGVSLVRRRSGGGAVFHDGGNVNFSVICPPDAFDRNRHAEMVVRALRRLGVAGSRVNERHDIVVDREGHRGGDAPPAGTFKISGSAYKLTRLRSLHHGTCLLGSPNLAHIGRLLRSPAEPYVKARGVESVRSRICNVGVPTGDFMDAVRREFGAMYGAPDVDADLGLGVGGGSAGGGGPDFAHEAIQKGYRELTVSAPRPSAGFWKRGIALLADANCRFTVPGLDLQPDAAVYVLDTSLRGRP